MKTLLSIICILTAHCAYSMEKAGTTETITKTPSTAAVRQPKILALRGAQLSIQINQRALPTGTERTQSPTPPNSPHPSNAPTPRLYTPTPPSTPQISQSAPPTSAQNPSSRHPRHATPFRAATE